MTEDVKIYFEMENKFLSKYFIKLNRSLNYTENYNLL